MPKIDLKRDLKHLYNPSANEVSVVEVPVMQFLMIDGSGNPNTSQAYADAVEALYSLAYALKFKVKKGSAGVDYTVMPLEGLWWADDMSTFSVEQKEDWQWTMMIMQPEYVNEELVMATIPEVAKKKKFPTLEQVQFATFDEGTAAQIMHIGSYADEAPTVAKIHNYIEQHDYKLRGKHHEIYLGDPRKTAPAKLRTIVRQPYKG